MRFRPVVTGLFTAAVLLLAMPQRASADAVVIQSGMFTYDTGDPQYFVVSGEGFTLRWSGFDFPTFQTVAQPTLCYPAPCVVGSTRVDFSTTLRGTLVNAFPAAGTIDGVAYDRLTMNGELSFVSAPFTFPVTSARTVHLESPFSFTGHITAFADPSSSVPVFDSDLIGAGSAGLATYQICGGCTANAGEYGFIAVGYRFSDASATPEPATLLLFGSGIVVVTRRLRKSGSSGRG